MKLAWTIYLVGLVFIIISLFTKSSIAFGIGFGLQVIGFIIQTIVKKKTGNQSELNES